MSFYSGSFGSHFASVNRSYYVYVNASGGTDHGGSFADGDLRANLVSGLNPGASITDVAISIYSNFAGNVRIKVYDRAGGVPTTLLGQTNSTALSSNGFNEIPLTSPATVPSGGEVYLAIEFDSNTPHPEGITGITNAKRVTHTYGTGPDPFGASIGNANLFYWRIKLQ